MKYSVRIGFLVAAVTLLPAGISSQISEVDKTALKEMIARLENVVASSRLARSDIASLEEMAGPIADELNVNTAEILEHNKYDGVYQEGTVQATQFAAEADLLNDRKKALIARLTPIAARIEEEKTLAENLDREESRLRLSIKLRSIDVLKFFDSEKCGGLPAEDAPLEGIKSYWDCVFDGTAPPRKFTPVPVGAVVAPDFGNPWKLSPETKKRMSTSGIVVPSPVIHKDTPPEPSLSEKLKNYINKLRKPPVRPTVVLTHRG